jgi:hypothetical protein
VDYPVQEQASIKKGHPASPAGEATLMEVVPAFLLFPVKNGIGSAK